MGLLKKKIIIFLGPPGSGKGTVCQTIVGSNKKIVHFSVGTLCRKYANEDTALGKSIKNLIDKGNLISFENISLIINDCLDQFFFDSSFDVLLLDGFPRNNDQAFLLVEIYKKFFDKISFYFILLDAEEAVLKDRMHHRLICSNNLCEKIYSQKNSKLLMCCSHCSADLFQRKDDMPEIIEKRLQYYFSQKNLIFDVFQKRAFEISIFDTNKSFDLFILELENFFKLKNINIYLK